MTDDVNVVLKGSVEGFDRINKELSELRSALEASGADVSEFSKRLDNIERAATKGARATSTAAKANREQATTAKQAATATTQQAAAAERGAKANQALGESSQQLASTRYALYDVANAYAVMGAALAGAATYAAVVGAQFEAAFTNVERTLATNATSEEVEAIRQSLVQLSGQIPLTFQELSQIATIGNQMDIAKESIVDFTGTIARFSSVAGISIDETTKAFGGFMAQTGLAPKYLENLGSAIAKVGLDSNATEAQILSLMREITTGATQAGFAADNIVGLAGTLASLQVPPERARGSLTTYFGTLNRAVAKGGDDLKNFAIVTRLTTDELSRMVDAGEGGEVFRRFLDGLSDTSAPSEMTQALDALGLSQLRVSDVFTRLSGALGRYDRDQQNANTAFLQGAELSRQYAMTMDDLASQWQIFINGINGLVNAISGGATPTLAALLANINNVIFALTAFLGTDAGKWVAGAAALVTAIVGVIGVMVLVRGALLAGTAATYAMRTAIAQMGAQALASAGTLRGLAGALFGVRNAAGAATGGILTLRSAIRGLLAATGIGLLVTLAGSLVGGLMDSGSAAQDAAISMDEYNSQVKKAQGGMSDAGGAADSLGDSVDGVGKSAAATAAKVRTLVDYVADLSGVFRRSSDIRFGPTAAMDEITLKWITLREQADEYQRSIRTLTADRKLKQYWLDIANLYDDQIRASELREDIAKIDDDLAKAQAGASTELQGNSRAAIENRKKMRELLGGYEDYIEALAAAGYSQEQIQAVIRRLNGEFTSQATALGFSGAELITYQNRFKDLSTIVAQVPRDITVRFNGNPALQALNEFFAKVKEQATTAGEQAGGNISSGIGSGFDESALDDLIPVDFGVTEGEQAGTNWWEEFLGFLEEVFVNFPTTLGEMVGSAIDTIMIEGGKQGEAFWNGFTTWLGDVFVDFPQWLMDRMNGVPIAAGKVGTSAGTNAGNGVISGTSSALAGRDPIGLYMGGVNSRAWSNGNAVGTNIGNGVIAGLQGSLTSAGKVNWTNNVQAPAGIRKPYANGGYTGAGHWLKPAGIVHAGEYVIPKRHVNQSTGLPDANYVANLQRGRSAPKMGYATGGHVSGGGFGGPVELGPATIGMLINGMSVRLNVGREQLASATSRGNKGLAFTGSN